MTVLGRKAARKLSTVLRSRSRLSTPPSPDEEDERSPIVPNSKDGTLFVVDSRPELPTDRRLDVRRVVAESSSPAAVERVGGREDGDVEEEGSSVRRCWVGEDDDDDDGPGPQEIDQPSRR